MGLPRAKRRACLFLVVLVSCFVISSPQRVFAVNATFTYDAVGRLLTAQYADGQRIAYTYDAVGNMTRQVATGTGYLFSLGQIIQLLLDNKANPGDHSSMLHK